ncbi:MAG TPA: transglutaminase domain-containing protein, partial [Candidatus Saccharimonadales bacterium]|nr:transglutaminase domain-containing protein [Candidatus Saccharimonadales bacterium]
MKRVLFILLLFFFSSLFPNHIFADDKFSTSADTTYTVSDNGTTHVAMDATIQNTTNTYYVTTYSLQVGYSDITNLRASDPNGPIVPVIQKTQNGEIINLSFNSIVYGEGTKLPFSLSFDTNTIASHNGSIWEVDIPGLSNLNDFSDFSVHVIVPPSFGDPTYIKPEQPTSSLTFSKDQLGKSGISLAFGKNQAYDYSLLYHLKNTNLFPIKTEIALPPNTNYQQVVIASLTPKPLNVTEDADDNWLASYSLLPSQMLTIKAQGTIFVSLYPTTSQLSPSEKALYLKPSADWQTTNPQIEDLARQLKTPENIYDYVVNHLTYDFARVNNNQTRFGAVGILQNPTQAVCLEFTDLFVAIARAAGIPAREIDGYGYTQNTKERPISQTEDILHAWPEYYDGQKWVMVDPTWGNTTGGVDYFHVLDFDHIAFSIKGA